MPTWYRLDPRDKPALLREMMRALAGDARIAFEGNLSRCLFPPHLCPSGDETDVLHRSHDTVRHQRPPA